MDNETSKAVKDYITKEETMIQYVEADNHSVNASKHAIKTIKNHFLAGLAPHQAFPHLLKNAKPQPG